ncbi:hypothetical protein [Roseateles puraquae]|uniref:Uncharacterized protein n=1 Tax=Roseateles puraquae TaxID=431059 RepID=A0A254N3H4_9BURK|nr:hypothetical protein [Roseateles puraquae]MDG0856466.1 hypothetical protein [Roseateles puraquae]OWR02681.1 hypothetical protein CDO81_17780 [Roseateles puraquae]
MTERALRAAVARRLLADAPNEARSLTWAQLDAAPAWLALAPDDLMALARRCGSVLAAPALRLWIAGPLRELARATLGPAWWRALRSAPDWPALPAGLPTALADWPPQNSPDALGQQFTEAGAAVLLASLPHGALRHAASRRLGAVGAWVMPQATALAVLRETLALQEAVAEGAA